MTTEEKILTPKLEAFKLKELAKIENVHYQTVLERKKRGIYVAVVIRSGKSGKESYRYFPIEISNILRALLAANIKWPEITKDPVEDLEAETF
jgi:hypothetical protein